MGENQQDRPVEWTDEIRHGTSGPGGDPVRDGAGDAPDHDDADGRTDHDDAGDAPDHDDGDGRTDRGLAADLADGATPGAIGALDGPAAIGSVGATGGADDSVLPDGPPDPRDGPD